MPHLKLAFAKMYTSNAKMFKRKTTHISELCIKIILLKFKSLNYE